MAIFHCSVKTVSRSTGRSAVASAAYRAGEKLKNERDGMTHDYTKKPGVLHSEIITPDGAPEWSSDREKLWNAAEIAEKRVNSTVAREYEIALPSELNRGDQISLAKEFTRHIVDTYGVAADVAVHEPSKTGNEQNVHAHILTSTRLISAAGFAEKTRMLDDRKSGEVGKIREKWGEMCNAALARSGSRERVDHRSNADRGMEEEPTIHLGPAASAMERRGEASARGDHNRRVKKINAMTAEASGLKKAIMSAKQEIIQEGRATARASFESWKREKAAARQREEERQQQRQQRQRAEQEKAAARERAAARENERGRGFSR